MSEVSTNRSAAGVVSVKSAAKGVMMMMMMMSSGSVHSFVMSSVNKNVEEYEERTFLCLTAEL